MQAISGVGCIETLVNKHVKAGHRHYSQTVDRFSVRITKDRKGYEVIEDVEDSTEDLFVVRQTILFNPLGAGAQARALYEARRIAKDLNSTAVKIKKATPKRKPRPYNWTGKYKGLHKCRQYGHANHGL